MKIKISTDSTADLGNELMKKRDIGVVPLTVLLGDESFRDGVDIVPEDIFKYVAKTGQLPKTSAPAVEDYKRFFSEQLKSYDAVIHFDISSKASASNSNALKAVEELGKDNIYVVDSYALSTGQGLLVMKACDLRDEGKAPEEIVEECRSLVPKVNTSFVPDELDYLHKGGRCSLTSLIGAKILSIHPMIKSEDGQLVAKRRYIGNMTRCTKKYVEDIKAMYPEYDRTRCFVTHSPTDPALCAAVVQLVKDNFDFEEVIETDAGSIVTSHCGRGTIGVLFIGK